MQTDATVEISADLRPVLEVWLKEGSVIGVYRNQDLGSASLGHTTFVRLSLNEEPPARAPDGPHGTGWRYCYERTLTHLVDVRWVDAPQNPWEAIRVPFPDQPPLVGIPVHGDLKIAEAWLADYRDIEGLSDIRIGRLLVVRPRKRIVMWAVRFRDEKRGATDRIIAAASNSAWQRFVGKDGGYFRLAPDGQHDWYVTHYHSEEKVVGFAPWHVDGFVDDGRRKPRPRYPAYWLPHEGDAS